MRSPLNPRRQRGITLLEALIAFLVLALGMLAVTRLQSQLRLNADLARERSEAVRLAQEELESLRAFAALSVYDGMASLSRNVDADTGYASHTAYRVARQIDPGAAPQSRNAAVNVGWTDRNGAAQQVTLNSIIAGTDPAYSGALALARSGAPVKGAFGRSVRIPLGAKDLGNGSSVFKPVSNGTIAFVFDNRSGLLTGRCTGIATATPTRDLTGADLGSCDAAIGQLLSGSVRFSSASPPDAAHANDVPLASSVALVLTGGPYPSPPDCTVEAMKTVSYTSGGSLHLDAVPLGASAAAMGLAAWTDTGERHLAYHCAVIPPASGQWSGRSSLVPSGWSIGTLATDRRVCRYSSDLDGSGAIDANIEHPASYSGVENSLANQNFLVINGNEACPGGATAPHQP